MNKKELKKKVLPYWKEMRQAQFDYYSIVQIVELEMQKKIGKQYEFAANDDGVYFGIGKVRKNGTRKCVLNDMELGGVNGS